jgi:hypothetical protein
MIIPCIVHPAQLCGCGHDVLPDKTILKNKQRNDGFEGGKLLGLWLFNICAVNCVCVVQLWSLSCLPPLFFIFTTTLQMSAFPSYSAAPMMAGAIPFPIGTQPSFTMQVPMQQTLMMPQGIPGMMMPQNMGKPDAPTN